jgi:hypothetical protein
MQQCSIKYTKKEKSHLKDIVARIERREFVCVGLYANPRVKSEGEQVVHYLEPMK